MKSHDEMIERVADAVATASMMSPGGPHHIDRESLLYMARAAIAAMRDPTKEMVVRGDDCCGVSCHGRRTWQEMIDSALGLPRSP